MRMTILTLALFAALAVSAVAAPTAKTSICGQVTHGPKATYTSLLLGKKISGTTWTVFATGVQCSVAMKAAPAILKWWAKAKIEAHATVAGFSCNKESDGHGSAGSAGCLPVHGKPLANIELIMTGSMSLAQLKGLFGG
jgi:hypothetical protein